LAFLAALLTSFVAAMFVCAQAAELGATVTNIATVDFPRGPTIITIQTPPASFTIEARRTPSTIDFLRYAPNAPDGVMTQINGSDFTNSTDASGNPVFQPVGPPITAGGAALDFSAPVSLVSADAYFSGELIIIRVIDEGQNGNPAQVETLVATIASGTGDLIVLRLYESGPNTGEFFAYVPSTTISSPVDDAVLSISREFSLTATYQDPFDLTEISTDVAGVDPFGRLFDSVTGDLIDGAQVTIVDAVTGQPAQVFGIDGVSAYPSTITTGSQVTDASGFIYALGPGEFSFPIMFPGDYRLEIVSPGDYRVPSAATEQTVATLPNAPFIIVAASYLGTFILDGTGDVSFDVPLDPRSVLVVQKEASAQTGAIGDFIRYAVTVENTGTNSAFLAIHDELPKGFRYQAGSARRDGAPLADADISANGGVLTFQLGASFAGDSVELTYVAEVTSGAEMGDAVNRAFAIDGAGAAISNIAEFAVFIREDLLRSRLTIVGRVAEGACNPNDEWPRETSDGAGVPNVRLYMENGANVLTDDDGLFHFEDVEARTHVVQLDTASLSSGYEAVRCEENTRFAGSAISQFVDAQGGSVWRANFYVQKLEGAAAGETGATPAEANFNDATEYLSFDKAWINAQTGETAWAYPEEGRTPSIRSVNIGVKHDATLRATLLLNGKLVSPHNFSGREVGLTRKVALTRWRGVDLLDGENLFVAIISDQTKKEVGRIERRISFVNNVARAAYLPEQSALFADGQTPPKIAVRVTDGAGRPVHAGRLITVEIEPPYRAKDLKRLENSVPLTAPLSSQSTVSVGPDGIALIELEPTTQTGNARVRVSLDDGREKEISAYLKPALRDWIVVGLADGKLGMETTTSGDPTVPKARDLLREGRIAVFAKGAVKGGWLITAAVDTAKKRGVQDDGLFEEIDPDARYPLYGDRSNQQFEAESRYPVYLKAEKGAFQALLGDYDTGLSDAKLGRYARRLSGVRTVYEGERFSFTGFAAETNQDFVRDEFAADGTSGTFRLTTTPIVRNSETVVIETRDRFRPDIIISTTSLARYVDYDIDFRTGEILFRLPIPAANDSASYNVIVAEYETFAPVERNITAGGRAAARFFGGRAEIGVTGIHEEGRPGATDSAGDLAAVDLVIDASETTELRLEYGYSRRDTDVGRQDGDAILAEVNHVSGDLTASAYYSETDAGFGLNHQSSATVGVRRYGLEANYRFDQFENAKTGRRGDRFISAKVYREENLVTGARRTLAEVELRQEADLTSAAVGLRRVVEEPATGETRKSLLATTAIRQNFPKIGLSIYATRDQPISGENGSNFFPKRTTAGFDQRVFDSVTLSVSHEIQDGANASSSNTIVGVTAQPWTGANITASTDMIMQESGKRIGATLGVDQQVQLTKKWSGSFGMSRRQELRNDGVIDQPDDIVPDAAFSPLEEDSNYTSIFIGAGYRSDLSTGSARFEMRKSALGQRYTSVLGAAREVSETLSFAGAARVEQENNDLSPDRQTIDARLGMAWRPRGEGLIAFNRFDIKRDRTDGQSDSWKAINNLTLNAMINERTQLTVNHGIKYSELAADGATFSGITQLLGGEARFDITEWLDVGLRGSALYSHNARTLDYSYGPSIGITPGKNIWLSAGWNFDGFTDDDFLAADFTRQGPYIQMRIKFDQSTAEGLLNSISPDSVRGTAQ